MACLKRCGLTSKPWKNILNTFDIALAGTRRIPRCLPPRIHLIPRKRGNEVLDDMPEGKKAIQEKPETSKNRIA
jgi:hypothetical protein